MARAPAPEPIGHGRDQWLGDALVPKIGADRQRAEEPDAAPVGGEVDAGERAGFIVGGEGGGVLAAEPAIDVIEIGPEIVEICDAHKGAEGAPHDALRMRQIALLERTYGHHCCYSIEIPLRVAERGRARCRMCVRYLERIDTPCRFATLDMRDRIVHAFGLGLYRFCLSFVYFNRQGARTPSSFRYRRCAVPVEARTHKTVGVGFRGQGNAALPVLTRRFIFLVALMAPARSDRKSS